MMNEFLLSIKYKGGAWRSLYHGLHSVEALMEEICEHYGLELEREGRPHLLKEDQKEYRKRRATVPPSDQLNGLTFTLNYTSPLCSTRIAFTAKSPSSGKTELYTEDITVITTTIYTLISTHDSEHGKWISFRKFED